MTKLKEVKKITWQELRTLCIKNEWYTLGTNEEYEKLLKMCDKKPTTKTIQLMAEDIYKHSELSNDYLSEVANIAHYIASDAMIICYEWE